LLRIQLKTLGLNIKLLEACSFQQSAFSGGGRRWTSDCKRSVNGRQSLGQHPIPLRSVKEDSVDFERASWPGGDRRYGKENGAR
jgi:hypothetical protein